MVNRGYSAILCSTDMSVKRVAYGNMKRLDHRDLVVIDQLLVTGSDSMLTKYGDGPIERKRLDCVTAAGSSCRLEE